MKDEILSDLMSPVVSAVHLLMLPIWLLIFVQQQSSPNTTGYFVAIGMVALSVPFFGKGFIIFRQRVLINGDGITMGGLGGFSVPWSDVESLALTPAPRTGNLLINTRLGIKLPTDMVVGKTSRRRIGIAPEHVQDVVDFAKRHNITLLASPERPGKV